MTSAKTHRQTERLTDTKAKELFFSSNYRTSHRGAKKEREREGRNCSTATRIASPQSKFESVAGVHHVAGAGQRRGASRIS